MPKKPDRIDSKKISQVSRANASEEAHKVEKVDAVKDVEAADLIGTVKRSGSDVRHQFSLEDKEKLFALVEEEAVKLFGNSSLSPEKRELIQQAVKTAIESGLITRSEE